jgi:hypothetical protein
MASGNGAQYLPGGGASKVPLWTGMYAASVVQANDPLGEGRLRLQIPQVLGTAVSAWALPMTPYVSAPPVGSQVSAMFIGGDPTRPAWFGSLELTEPGTAIQTGIGNPNTNGTVAVQVGAIYYDMTGGTISGTYEWNGTTWEEIPIGGSAIETGADLDAPNITGGTITGAVFRGTNWVENSYGSFLYSGTPAAGNLILSLAPSSGSDAEWTTGAGNEYNAGLQVIGESGGSIIIDPSANSGVPYISLYPLGATKLTAAPQIYAGVLNPGAVNEEEMLVLYSGQSQTGNKNAALQLFSDPANASSQARANFVLDGASTSLTSTLAQAYLPATQGAWADNIVETTSMSKLSSIWSIPANDANANTCYRLKGYGMGLQDANAFNFQVTAWGQVIGTLGIGAVAFPTGSNSIDFEFEVIVGVLTTGTNGSANASIRVTMSPSSGNVGAPPAGSQFTVSGAQNPGATVPQGCNTTVASNITLQASVSTTTNSPYIECTFNTLERLGA